MAFSSLKFVSSLLLIITASLLISPATSQTCKSQTFTQNATFANCEDLPTLNSFLHWTYDSSAKPNPTLTVAFIAPPATPHGWVAWALNPTDTAMFGSQALIAFRETNGSVVVKTYNIQSYTLHESPISYEVLAKRAEFSGGVIRLFATLGLPEAGASSELEVNQVWQVGPSVTNGVPSSHALAGDNLSSSGTLRLVSTPPTGSSGRVAAPAPTSSDASGRVAAPAPTSSDARGPPAPTSQAPTSQAPTSSGGRRAGSDGNAPPAPASSGGNATPGPARESGNDNGGSSMIGGSGFGLYGILVLLGVVLGF